MKTKKYLFLVELIVGPPPQVVQLALIRGTEQQKIMQNF